MAVLPPPGCALAVCLGLALFAADASAQPRVEGIYQTWFYSHADSPNAPIHRYIRFFPDRSALVVSTSDAPEQVAQWLTKEQQTGDEGRYSMKGADVTLEVPTPTGMITYSGRIDGDQLVFGVGKYRFLPFSATSAAAGQNRPPVVVARKNVVNNFLMDSRGERVGLSTTVEIGASDPDGDPLTYTWKADNGHVACSGPTCTWRNRPVHMGRVDRGYLTVIVDDGKEGRTSRTWLMF